MLSNVLVGTAQVNTALSPGPSNKAPPWQQRWLSRICI